MESESFRQSDSEVAEEQTEIAENEEQNLLVTDEPPLDDENGERPRLFQRIPLIILVGVSWISGILFGLYMFGHYIFAGKEIERWNTLLPSLYRKDRPLATLGIGAHFLGGAIAIMLGAIQLVGPIRKHYPSFHRWTGRLYLICSILTALGGLLYISITGCIGGKTMDVAFSLCALLTLVSSGQAYRHAAITKRYDQHQLWAWRLYSLMIASWMYRLEYATAELFRIPHDSAHYAYALDFIMDFFFYVPNLFVVEVIWRSRHKACAPWVSNLLSLLVLLVALVVLLTSLMNAIAIWIPGMMGKLADLRSDDDETARDAHFVGSRVYDL
jgi:hypothetical protein